MSRRTTILALSVLGLTGLANAACSHDVRERGLAQNLARRQALELQALQKRQSPSSLQGQEALLDPQQECSYYSYPPVEAIISQYPPTWEIAQIVSTDTEARNAFNAIVNDPQMPKIGPKGSPAGDFTGANYSPSDPDCWWTWSKCTTSTYAGIPADTITCNEPSTWGLTFDDGPNCTHNAFYNYLQQQKYTATMFFIGSNVMNWPFQAQRALADGHEIGLHTWSHHYMTGLTNEQIFAELWYTRKAIKAVIGITPKTWRAPFGDVDNRVRFIATKMGLTLVLWDHDMLDWQVQNSGNPNGLPTSVVQNNYNQMYALAAQGTFNTHGTIVLTHEINGATMQMAMDELPAIAGNFKHIVPVATCQNITQPYVEQNYTFPTFQQHVSGVNGSSVTNISSITAVSSATSGSAIRSTRTSLQTSTVSHAAGAAANAQTTSAATTLAVSAPLAMLLTATWLVIC